MIIMGIDPSIKKGQAYSVWNDMVYIASGKIYDIKEFINLIKIEKPDLVLIEDQYLSFNYKTAKELTLISGRMIGILDYFNIKHQTINVATWQSKLGLVNVGKGEKPYKRKKMKKQAIIDAASIFVEDIKDDDIASAILIPYAMMGELW